MSKVYHSETAKFRELEQMKYIQGGVLDIGCGDDKIIPSAIGFDGRALPGVDLIQDDPYDMSSVEWMDTIFSSHFLEHLADQYGAIKEWSECLHSGGHLVLYLPDGDHYNNKENPEHMVDMKHDPFIFWIKRAFCGEGKDFRGDRLPKTFDFVESGMDLRENCYSFYCILRKL